MKEAALEQQERPITAEAGVNETESAREDTLRKALRAISALKQKLADEKHRATEAIAVVGMACRLPGGCATPEAFWDILVEGRRAVGPVPESRWKTDDHYNPVPGTPGKMYVRELNFVDDVENFDCQFFGVTPKEARSLDPHQRLLLEVMWHALEDAGITASSIRGTDASVFMGQSSSDYSLRLNHYSDIEEMDGFVATGNNYSVTSGRMSYLLGINGPCMTIDTACSSSLVCLNQAVEALRNGRTGMALVGASHVMSTPESCLALSHAQALAPDGISKPFDDAADGYGRGEGGAVLVLKRLSDAERDGDRIMALIEESVINQDGASGGLMVPNGDSQAALIRAALEKSGLGPDDIQYIEAHGTGTPIGDPIEAAAIGEALGPHGRDESLLMGSCKANIGHLEAASGMAALLKVVMMLQRRQIVGQPGTFEPSRNIDWTSMSVEVPMSTRHWAVAEGQVRRAGINGFGFSGMNGHVIMREYRPPMQPAVAAPPVQDELPLLPLSAKNPAVLARLCEEYQEYLVSSDTVSVCRAAAQRRDHWSHRAAVFAQSPEDMRHALQAHARGNSHASLLTGSVRRTPRPVFMFTGQGAQYIGMGKHLYDTQPVFRQVMDACNAAVLPIMGRDLVQLMLFGEETELANTAHTQPALFALEVALAALWRHWGIEPSAVVGHSVGQYAAACVAGVFSVEDGARLIAERGQLMAQLPASGSMLAISADRSSVEALIETLPLVEIAAINGPEQTVVSGDLEAISRIEQDCAKRGLSAKALNVSHAFHSPLMDPILAPFREVAGRVDFRAPDIELLCNITGDFADLDTIVTPDYWVQHLRHAVDFNGCMSQLLSQGYDCFIEIGPAPVLSAMGEVVARHKALEVAWIPTLRRQRENGESEARRQVQYGLAAAYCAGVDLHWERVQGGCSGSGTRLPPYPFEKKRFWPEADGQGQVDKFVRNSPLNVLQGSQEEGALQALLAQLVTSGAIGQDDRPVAKSLLEGLKTLHQQACRYGDLDDWFHELRWIEAALPDAAAPMSAHWLILQKDENCAFASDMRRELEAAGHRVSTLLTAAAGPQCLSSLGQSVESITEIDHCLLLSHWEHYGDDGSVDFDDIRAQSVDILLELVQVLERSGGATRVWIPTRQAWDIDIKRPGVGHFHSPLWIMARNLYREMPHRLGGALDLSVETDASILHDALERLIASDQREEYQWLLRGETRYVPRLAPIVSLPLAAQERWLLDPLATYMVTGPFGGIGLALTQLLVDCGARNLCLVSRSGPASDSARQAVDQWRAAGVNVDAPQVDVAVPSEVSELFESLDATRPLKGLIHTAGVTSDGMLEDLSPEDFARVMAPKVNGTWLLDRHTRQLPLQFFVCFSSTSALLGAPGLANYASANFYMDALMAQRRSIGQPGFSIQWGTWAEVGMVAKLGQSHLKRQASQGWQLIGTGDGMRAFERIMMASESGAEMPTTPIVMPVADWSRVLTVLGGRQDPQFELLAENLNDTDELDVGVEQAIDKLRSLTEDEQLHYLTASLKTRIAIGFGFDEAELSIDESLVSLGMDSLLAVQLKMALQKMLGVDLPLEVLLEGASISELATAVLVALSSEADAGDSSGKVAVPANEQVSMVL